MHYDFQFFTSGEENNDWICFSSDKEKRNTDNLAGIFFNNHYFRQQLKIMQFTGLKDKNGKNIYEGDILLITNPLRQIQKARLIGAVEFEWASYAVEIKRIIEWKSYNVDATAFMLLSSIAGSREMAVIGNIYENPELLK
jgi:uncharacterized phage protein (TIGR01671 family)